MADITLYNSLSRTIEPFIPLHPPKVGVYTCGPTVYDHVTIGNWRTYITSDIVNRTLQHNGFDVDFIMNITDVGHLTGDNEGDASTGIDRMEKGALREGVSAWEVAKQYTDSFFVGYDALNITKPRVFARATEHINEQIDLIKKIEERGFTYKTSDGIYFDTTAYENAGFNYGELSNLDVLKEGARVEINKEKKNAHDFALWKLSPTDTQRDMEWESPWGVGFPGWHIECSAMSMKYLGNQFDIHIGGEDLRETHHPNEIAQAQSACDCSPFVRYWIHGSHLMVEGGRMGKSVGNAYTLADLEKKGFSPLSLRYLYLSAHYRKQQNFTWEALTAAQHSLKNLYTQARALDIDGGNVSARHANRFTEALNVDFSTPKALAVMWDMLRDENLSSADMYATLLNFDSVFGLGVQKETEKAQNIPENIVRLVSEREIARKNEDWQKADEIRKRIEDSGFQLSDSEAGPHVSQK